MDVLFIHQAFPAQFGRLALELTRRHGWKCRFLVQHLGTCPVPAADMLDLLEPQQLVLPGSGQRGITPWTQAYGLSLEVAEAVATTLRAGPDGRPDLVVGHCGLGPTLFVPEVLACPIVTYCEYYHAARGRDLTYRVDLPFTEPAPFYPRSINAATLVNLLHSTAGYAPTHWQRQSFPEHWRSKIEVHFDGIDTALYRPHAVPVATVSRVLAGRSLPPGTRVVTFVARGLESMRGFDLFLRLAQRIAHARADVLFVVVGSEESYYGWDRLHIGQPNFKEWALRQGDYDLSRFVFLGQVEPEPLAEVLAISTLHVYLTVPFALSWSLFNALASGCVVLAADVGPVREIIEPGVHGLLEPLFDTDRMAETALRVLDDPPAYRPLGQAGRALMEERYSVDVAVPELKDFFERVAGRYIAL